MIGVGLFLVNLAAFVLLVWRGGWPERLGSAALLSCILAEPLLAGWQVGTWRLGLLFVNGLLFLALWALAERFDRWWLIFVAGFQLIIVVSHVIPMANDRYFTVALIGIRMGVWVLISLTLFIGVWEGWASRKLAAHGA